MANDNRSDVPSSHQPPDPRHAIGVPSEKPSDEILPPLPNASTGSGRSGLSRGGSRTWLDPHVPVVIRGTPKLRAASTRQLSSPQLKRKLWLIRGAILAVAVAILTSVFVLSRMQFGQSNVGMDDQTSSAAASESTGTPPPEPTRAAETAPQLVTEVSVPATAPEAGVVTAPPPAAPIAKPSGSIPTAPAEPAETGAAAPTETAANVPATTASPPAAAEKPPEIEERAPAAIEASPAPTPVAVGASESADRASVPTNPSAEPIPASAPPAVAPTGMSNLNEAAIRETLGRYVQAYDRLDAKAAAAVWPSVDQQALTRAFSALRLQKVGLDRCDITSSDGSTATALCAGSVQYVRTTGAPAPQVEKRRWEFRLKRQDTNWQIVNVSRLNPGVGTAPSGAPVASAAIEPLAAGGTGTAGVEETAIRRTLGRYAQSYDRLDAKAAAAVWPSVDERALTRAFSELRLQKVGFDRCDVAIVDASTATALCVGTVQYVRNTGNATPQLERRKWEFRLTKPGAAWQIASVSRLTPERE